MNDKQYQQLAINYLQDALGLNPAFIMLVRRWREDKELQLMLSTIHDLLHADRAVIKDIIKVDGTGQEMFAELKKVVPDLTIDELRFAAITAVVLFYMRGEA